MTNNSTKLREINFGINQFCGPAVLSALTGKTTDECSSVIMGITGRNEVRAVDIKDLIKALEKLRFDAVETEVYGYSLFAVLNNLVHKEGLYIILIKGHFIAIEVKDGKILICDNHTKSPMPAEGSARLIQQVLKVFKVTERAAPKFLSTKLVIEDRHHSLQMRFVDYYEDERDNVTRNVGSIYYRTHDELCMIVERLKGYGHT